MTADDVVNFGKTVEDKSKDIALSAILQFIIVTLVLSNILDENAVKKPFRKGAHSVSKDNTKLVVMVVLIAGIAWVIKNHRAAESAVGNN